MNNIYKITNELERIEKISNLKKTLKDLRVGHRRLVALNKPTVEIETVLAEITQELQQEKELLNKNKNRYFSNNLIIDRSKFKCFE